MFVLFSSSVETDDLFLLADDDGGKQTGVLDATEGEGDSIRDQNPQYLLQHPRYLAHQL